MKRETSEIKRCVKFEVDVLVHTISVDVKKHLKKRETFTRRYHASKTDVKPEIQDKTRQDKTRQDKTRENCVPLK